MSRLLIITRPALVNGFRLAGVDASGAADIESAEALVLEYLRSGESGLLAIDDGFLARMRPEVLKQLREAGQLPFLAIPGGQPLGPEASRQARIAGLLRQAIGFHITFKGAESAGIE